MTDYGYGDAAPDSAGYGYGDAAPDADKYGYGDTGQQDSNAYGYGDAAPDNQYGYGDAAPDNNPYGYGDATPANNNPYGYGDSAPSSSNQYGYGDAAPDDNNPYGYGDSAPSGGGTYQMGYNDEASGGERDRFRAHARNNSHHSTGSAVSYGEYGEEGGQPRRQRYRRRGSVTKYSLDAQDTVKQEYDANAHAIQNHRDSGGVMGMGDSMQPMDTEENHQGEEQDEHSLDGHKKKKKRNPLKKGAGKLRRFTMGY